ncbi:cytochrome c-type biogenesis protein CcmH [Bacillus sp. C11]|nr:cytochrome c-type biogenesis protein CcmH [Neobacillus terrae]
MVALLVLLVAVQWPFVRTEARQIDYKSPEFRAVASQFACTCGCGQDHFECDPNTCNLTKEFKKDLSDMMGKGMNKDQIRDYYVKIYGEEILTAPEKSGFSLAAWILPFAVLAAAAVGIFFIIRKWVKKKRDIETLSEPSGDEDGVESEILSSIIDEERKKYL